MSEIITSLTGNAALLGALIYLYGQIRDRNEQWQHTEWMLTGALFGLFAIIEMMTLLVLTRGIIVDLCVMVIFLCAVLAGWRGGLVAVLIAAVYRISLGGAGAMAGVITLATPLLIGAAYHHWRRGSIQNTAEIAMTAVVVVVVNVPLGYVLLPASFRLTFVQNTAIPFLILYPLTAAIITEIIKRRDNYLKLVTDLRESKQRFHAIFNQTFQFIGLLKPDGTLLEANQTALAFGGITLDEIAGKPFWEARWWTINEKTQAQLKVAIHRASRGEFVRYNVEVLGQGDQTVTIDFSLKPITNEHGEVILLIPEGRDITDRLLVQQREVELVLEQERNQIMKEFIAESAHHLRTPIAVVKSSLYVCQKRLEKVVHSLGSYPDLPVEVQKSVGYVDNVVDKLEACDTATDNLTRVVDDMLQISSLNWKENFTFEEHDIVAIVNDCAVQFHDVAALAGIAYHVEPLKQPLRMVFDHAYIHTALSNLIKNAIHYTDEGGTVRIWMQQTGGELSITVSDTGIGIKKENLLRIFDQFYRTDSGMQANPGGTGLGLPFVKKVAENHSGMAMVTSEVGKGSSFTIRLPIRTKAAQVQQQPLLAQQET